MVGAWVLGEGNRLLEERREAETKAREGEKPLFALLFSFRLDASVFSLLKEEPTHNSPSIIVGWVFSNIHITLNMHSILK